MKRSLLGLTALCGFLLLCVSLVPAAHSDSGGSLLDEIVLSGSGFTGETTDLTVDGRGLSLTGAARSGEFTSQPIEAPFPFNVVVPEWIADEPDTAVVTIMLRTGPDGRQWGPWQVVAHNHDWTLPDDPDTVGDMVLVPSQDVRHRFVQVRVALSREAAPATPHLRELTLVVIDSTAGPTTAELLARLPQDAPDVAADGFPKPPVLPREGAGGWCDEPECVYTDGLEYYPVSHLILHHTVTSNDLLADYAPIVRAIWRFHTFSRGWGDIGYNYLVDPYGNIFEGHRGGDDVVGTHASGANTGSMGVAAIGDFGTFTPHGTQVDAVVNLFSWKADQRDINVFESSSALPGIAWGLPHLMGHRDAYGTTECPGDRAHSLIPSIRDRIAANLGLVSPHIYVDELSSSFTRSNAFWYDGLYNCGYNTHAWYTWSTTDPAKSANWGEWRPFIPAGGLYEIEVYAPYCNTGRAETRGAVYTVNHFNGRSEVVVDQNTNIGLWTSLGEYYLPAGTSASVSLIDLTTTDNDLGVWFDAIRLRPLNLAPSATNTAPANNAWLVNRNVAFSWQILEPNSVTAVTLEVATDSSFAQPIATKSFAGPVTTGQHAFSADYGALYWRVRLTPVVGDAVTSQPTRFGIDTTPPVSTVTALYYAPQTGSYAVYWRGADALTAVTAYTVETRNLSDATAVWQPLVTNTPATGGAFQPDDPGAIYGFRVRAVDQLGNAEAPKTQPDATTDQALSLPHAIMLPLLVR